MPATIDKRLLVAPAILKLIAACFVLSGATALIYEVLWARMLGLVFGATTVAISAVLTAFMGGLAIGSAVAARFVRRLQKPLRTYALIEMAVGLYALTVPALFRGMDQLYVLLWQAIHPGFYAFVLLRFVLAAIVLLAPTALMGATLPVLVMALRQFGDLRANSVARLYSLNLLGAIGGALAGGFFLLPRWGVSRSIWIAAIVNLLIGLAALVASLKTAATRDETSSAEASTGDQQATQPTFWFFCALISGFVTISMQVVWSRILTMIIGSSTYAFVIVLALFLMGLALGAWVVSRFSRPDPARLRRWIVWIQILTAISLFLSLRLTSLVPELLIKSGFRFGVNSWGGLLTMQLLAATGLILAPTILMGTVMPLVLAWAGQTRSFSSAKLVGQAYAVNTIGSIAGASVTALVLIPLTSARFTIFCAAALGVTVAAIAYEPKRSSIDRAIARSLLAGMACLLIIAMLLVWPSLNLNALSAGAYDSFVRVLAKSLGQPEQSSDQPADHQLLMYTDGRTATVSVRRDWGITSVAINGRTNGSDADDMPTQVFLGEIGPLVAPRTERALMIGFATGVTVGSILQSPVGSVDCVEIEPAAVASGRFFDRVNNHPLDDLRLRIVIDDVRTVLAVNPMKYDLIVSEPSHPWVPGVANLFTREFFALGQRRLNQDGVFVQWLQIYQLSTDSLRSVLATFHSVYPHVAVFRVGGAAKGKDLVLVGSSAPFDLAKLAERMKDSRLAAELSRIGLHSPEEVRAWFVCDENSFAQLVADAVINTDDNMYIETTAPREAFRPTIEENAAWIERLRL